MLPEGQEFRALIVAAGRLRRQHATAARPTAAAEGSTNIPAAQHDGSDRSLHALLPAVILRVGMRRCMHI
jgi:hypothetical protein